MNAIAEIRRRALQKLVEQEGLSNVARRMRKPDRQINDMIAGRKAFGEKVARAIEHAYDPTRPAGWLDREDAPTEAAPVQYAAAIQPVVRTAKERDSDTRYALSIHIEALRQSAKVIAEAFEMTPAEILAAALNVEPKPRTRELSILTRTASGVIEERHALPTSSTPPNKKFAPGPVIDATRGIPSGNIGLLPPEQQVKLGSKGGAQ